jgi:hypothetical protein
VTGALMPCLFLCFYLAQTPLAANLGTEMS